jgi:hypothetical protein
MIGLIPASHRSNIALFIPLYCDLSFFCAKVGKISKKIPKNQLPLASGPGKTG